MLLLLTRCAASPATLLHIDSARSGGNPKEHLFLARAWSCSEGNVAAGHVVSRSEASGLCFTKSRAMYNVWEAFTSSLLVNLPL